MPTRTSRAGSRGFALAAAALLACSVLVGVAARPAHALTFCDPNVTVLCPHAVDDTFGPIVYGTKAFSVPPPGVLANDSGPAGTIVDDYDVASAGGAKVVVQHNGAFTYTPNPRNPYSGIDDFEYEILDPQGDTDFADVTINVLGAAVPDSYTVVFNHHLTVRPPGVFANDKGLDPSTVSYDTTLTKGDFNDDDNGAFDYIPPQNFIGTDTFKYDAFDLDFDFDYTTTVTIHVVAKAPPPPPPPAKPRGYWMVGSGGHVYPFGQLKNYGNANTFGVTHIEPTPSRHGYWILNTNGQVFAFGDAKPFGGAGSLKPGETASSLSATPTGKGYWIFTNRGRVFARGDAHNFGDMRGVTLNGPIVGSSATPTGKGYWMVGTDGGIFSFGDAHFYGSTGNIHLNKPVNGLVPTPNNHGYWLVASDGGIFAFGNAGFHGSMGGTPLNRPIIGMVRYGNGYLMVSSDGGIFAFSNLPFLGSLANNPPAIPIVGVASGG